MGAETKAATISRLRAEIESVKPTGKLSLTPSVAKGIPLPTTEAQAAVTFSGHIRDIFPGWIESLQEIAPEHMEQALSDEAEKTFLEYAPIQKIKDKKLKTKGGRLGYIRRQFGYNRKYPKKFVLASKNYEESDKTLSKFMGITVNQVVRGDLRSRKIDPKEQEKFEQRFNALFTIASILEQYQGEDIYDKRVILARADSKISNISIKDAIMGGFPNIAVSIANDAVRQKQATMGIQTGLDS